MNDIEKWEQWCKDNNVDSTEQYDVHVRDRDGELLRNKIILRFMEVFSIKNFLGSVPRTLSEFTNEMHKVAVETDKTVKISLQISVDPQGKVVCDYHADDIELFSRLLHKSSTINQT